ncbi:hypothetical protein Pint_20532 [Pistacia integerrima]|uniref:Uncharacterized protein n=1 Tax=Pistacia integerrima TaxID=434235 RepID=A0ACC0XC32_9ROSI|nr:hypothetical protein Pint_20532 [Pistacia integerrima]
MFDGVPAEQFHQFITSSTRPSLPLPLPLSFSSSALHLHHHHHASSNTNIFPTFDPYTSTPPPSQQLLQLPHHHFLHPLHHHQQYSPAQKNHQDKQENNNSSSSLVAMNFEIERDRSIPEPVEVDPTWSNEEVLSLLRIRSSFENWFPEFIWEHVSRKLEETGYKRSADKCKAKFEEESQCFNNINYNKSYRLFSEFEEFYHGHQNSQVVAQDKNQKMEKSREEEGEEDDEMERDNLDEDSKKEEISVEDAPEDNEKLVEISKGKKRKRQKNFEMFKGFCKDIVKKMMAQQEEMMNKLLEDMMKRDKEKVAREEAWKKQEMDRINKELEIRAHEQVITGDRQTTIIKFLKGFTTSTGSSETESRLDKVLNTLNSPTSSSLNLAQNPNSPQNNLEMPTSASHQISVFSPSQSSPLTSTSLPQPSAPQNPSLNLAPTQNPNSPKSQNKQLPPTTSFSKHNATQINHGSSNDKEDLGKRWPRDEVFALINLRCSLYNNGEDKEGAAAKTPLWERISQGMLELGYKRSAKRCKEKWENINKYFRKTKDNNKKRSLDSRTCPYFHQLSTLYNQGTVVAPPSDGTDNRSSVLPENHNASSSQGGSSTTDSIVEGEKILVQAKPPAAFDFDF